MTYTCNPQWTKFSWFHWGLLYYKSKLRQIPLRNQTSLDAKILDSTEKWKSEMALRWTIPQMRKLKLQRYRKHKEEWLIWLLFQSFARRQSEDASSLLVSIWARPRTLYLWCKVAQRCGSGVNSNAYIAVGKQSCNGKCTNEYIFWWGEQKQW